MPNGSLRDILTKIKKGKNTIDLNDTNKLIIIYGIASGMMYLHSKNIILRDLRPEKILIDENFNVIHLLLLFMNCLLMKNLSKFIVITRFFMQFKKVKDLFLRYSLIRLIKS